MEQVEENRVHVISRADVLVLPGPLPYAEGNRASIAENWARECAANPTLFDGEVYLAPEATLKDGVLQAGFKRTRFATLMHWRRDPSPIRPWHIFSVGVIVSGEGHLIAARMGQQNAVAGKVYFPAGSIDDNDIFDARVDYDANCRREVREETGIDLADARAETQINLVTGNRSIALLPTGISATPDWRGLTDDSGTKLAMLATARSMACWQGNHFILVFNACQRRMRDEESRCFRPSL
ncbi:NUDIX hydrolase [Brucella melitensis]|uniref:NUDIX hydrolase n=1 Tax=Brucella melitensis TaxID=29459 RepID=UPI0002CE6707|nr:hypothetical protein C048_00814 [Brucella melitensis UK19/04]ENS70966.1 hypothetical protein C034_00429 [Brucella melitensis UK14/06]ENS75675.1 hypothetical protein C059_00429 [Brucella melitensis UK23/06]OCW15058.1 NUDIX hydrolase [Brucella melitensis]